MSWSLTEGDNFRGWGSAKPSAHQHKKKQHGNQQTKAFRSCNT